MNELEKFLAGLAKDAVTEIGPTEMHFIGEAMKAAFTGKVGEAGRLLELVAESVAAKIAADKKLGG